MAGSRVLPPTEDFGDGYAMGYADRHDGQSCQIDYRWKQLQALRAAALVAGAQSDSRERD